jgi:ribosomal protein S18 acetylase RimI-like enzyme
MSEDLVRVIAFVRRIEELTSTRTEAWRLGTVLRNDDFPDRWDSNFLRVERPVGAATAKDLAAEADGWLEGLRHREVVVEDDSEGGRLAAGFGDIGWEVDRLVYQVLRREPDREPVGVVDEVSFEGARPLLVEINRREHGGLEEETASMLADFQRLLVRHANARFFVARVDGAPAGCCATYALDGVAQVEDVHTLDEFRGRGLARAFVTRAAREAVRAGADLVFLIADDRDWPKELYGRLGFDPVGRFWSFARLPRGNGDR